MRRVSTVDLWRISNHQDIKNARIRGYVHQTRSHEMGRRARKSETGVNNAKYRRISALIFISRSKRPIRSIGELQKIGKFDNSQLGAWKERGGVGSYGEFPKKE